MTQTPRATKQRRALGRILSAHRMANGLTLRRVAELVGTGKAQLQGIERATSEVRVGVVIDVAALYGLHIAAVGDHHLPLLSLDAGEVTALLRAATSFDTRLPDDHPVLVKLGHTDIAP